MCYRIATGCNFTGVACDVDVAFKIFLGSEVYFLNHTKFDIEKYFVLDLIDLPVRGALALAFTSKLDVRSISTPHHLVYRTAWMSRIRCYESRLTGPELNRYLHF